MQLLDDRPANRCLLMLALNNNQSLSPMQNDVSTLVIRKLSTLGVVSHALEDFGHCVLKLVSVDLVKVVDEFIP